MKPKFSVGDVVVCVNDHHGIRWYEEGKKYTIRSEAFPDPVTDKSWSYKVKGYANIAWIGEEDFVLHTEPQTSNKSPSLVQKTTPKNDDSGEGVSQPRVDKNVWFERGELPPIGTVCEHEPSGFYNEWFSVEVLAHKEFKGHDTGLLVVFATEDDVSFSSGECFRPIKTAEEMEAELLAEEREKAVGAVEEQILEQMGELNVRNLAEHIVDTFDLRFPKGGK